MPRFVILHHRLPAGHGRPDHWDLMLECQGRLRTWALAEPPRVGAEIAAERLPDHRLAYLDYEGPVSEDRGRVTRWDHGHFRPPLEEALDTIRVELDGTRDYRSLTLTRTTFPSSWQARFG